MEDEKRCHLNNALHSNEYNSNCNDTVKAPSNFSHHYKNSGKTFEASASQRRTTFLNKHKEKHDSIYDKGRDLSELFEEIPSHDEEPEAMESENINVLGRKKRIKFRMTINEWLTDIPDDLEDKWLVKFCPEGKRRLIVANKRTTKSFNKYGNLISQFQSNLPGGGKTMHLSTHKAGLTVLDCVFHAPSRTYFVLDLLVWNSVSFLGCEAELRNFWIHAKYLEFPEFFGEEGADSFNFKVLPDYSADSKTIEKEMMQYSSKNGVTCEGILFYHKEVPYITGYTPLVTWLRPFMLPEKFDIRIPHEYEMKKPPTYVDMQSYLHNLSKWKRRKNRSKKVLDDSLSEMEFEQLPP